MKSFLAKIGAMMVSPLKRFLLSFAAMFIGACTFPIPLINIIGSLLVLLGMITAFSFITDTRDYYVKTIRVPTEDGEIPCVIIRQQYYAYIPILHFISPFYYKSFHAKYHLINNVDGSKLDDDSLTAGYLLKTDLLLSEEITEERMNALMADPSLHAAQLQNDLRAAKAAVDTAVAPFVEKGVLKPLYSDSHIAIFTATDNSHILCHYTKPIDKPIMLFFNPKVIEEIKKPAELFPIYARSSDYIENLFIANEQVLNALIENGLTTDEKLAEEAARRVEESKTVITRETIAATVLGRYYKVKRFWGYTQWFFALGCVELTILGIATLLIPIAVIAAPLGVFLIIRGRRNVKNAKLNKQRIENGEYRVIKTVCTDVTMQENDEGPDTYTTTLLTGESYSTTVRIASKGDFFYLIYMEDYKAAVAYFSGASYRLADDIIPEDRTTA